MAQSKRPEPAARERRKRALLERFDQAEDQWGAAMRAHRLAPPDAGFASRLEALSTAAKAEATVCREAAQLGLAWRPIAGAATAEPPYELRPGTGRRGPEELWERFDAAVAQFNRANAGADAAAVATAYAAVGETASALAGAVAAEDSAAVRQGRRGARTG